MSRSHVLSSIVKLLKSLVGPQEWHEPKHADPALVTFARLGLLAYYR
jgi:hypothetical protein